MASIGDLLELTEEKMMDALGALEGDFSRLRTGKATPGMVENLMVDYYGTPTRMRDIAGISTPESRLLVIQPWDQNALESIEKALHTSDLGISPVNDGKLIRLPIPDLTEERRKNLSKQARKRAEDARVEIRNHRRDANEDAKKAEKSSEISEDALKEILAGIQKLTDDYINKISETTDKKEKDIMQV